MTQPILNETAVRELIRQELPALVREDRKIRDWAIELGQERFADRDRTEGRIERMVDELRCNREQSDRKWEEKQAEDKRKWEKNTRKWEEQMRENRQEFKQVHEEIMAVNSRTDRTIGTLGARWGLINAERSFRDALAEILEKSFR